jgi:hypothetical protein
MNSMRLALVVPLMFVTLFADKSCGIDLGNIDDFVIQYDIVVTNDASEDALISVIGRDIQAQAIVKPGASVTATSYQGGLLIVWASSAVDRVAALKQQKSDLQAQVALGPQNPNFTFAWSQLQLVVQQLRAQTEENHTGSCSTNLKPDEHGKGGEYDFTAVEPSTFWSIQGLCGP